MINIYNFIRKCYCKFCPRPFDWNGKNDTLVSRAFGSVFSISPFLNSATCSEFVCVYLYVCMYSVALKFCAMTTHIYCHLTSFERSATSQNATIKHVNNAFSRHISYKKYSKRIFFSENRNLDNNNKHLKFHSEIHRKTSNKSDLLKMATSGVI